MKDNKKVIYKRIIVLTLSLYSTAVLISNAKVIKNLSVSREILEEIEVIDNLNVKVDGEFLGEDNFMPGDIIDNDNITLVNNEEFPVKFILDLDKAGDILNDKLKVNILGAKDVLNNDMYEVTVKPKESKNIYSNVKWDHSESDIEAANKFLNNIYNISAVKNNFIYECYFNEEKGSEDWTLQSGILYNSHDGMVISSEKIGDEEKYGKMFLSNITNSELSTEKYLEITSIIDVSELMNNGREKDGFDYYVTLNDENGNHALTFAFHMFFYNNKLRVYCNNQYEDIPSSNNSSILPNSNMLKFKYKFYNENGYLEVRLSIEDVEGTELYYKILNKKGQANENKWSMSNISDIRRVGFSGIRCNSRITVRYLNIISSNNDIRK